MHGRRLCAEFGGGRKKCRGPNFRMTFSSKKLTLFCLSFASLTVKSHVMQHMTLFFSKNLYFTTKHSFITFFLVNSYLAMRPKKLHLKILGGRSDGCMGRSPPQIFWGRSPSPPLSLRPCC